MKTTLEIPDRVFRLAKSKAAEQGKPLRQFVTEAVEDKLRDLPSKNDERPWMKHMGKLKGLPGLRKESRRINKLIEETFEKIDTEIWTSDGSN